MLYGFFFFFFFKQKTAYEMRISDWSSDVCSSDLLERDDRVVGRGMAVQIDPAAHMHGDIGPIEGGAVAGEGDLSFDRITEILADGRSHGVHDAAAQGVADVDLLACHCDMHWSDSFLSAAPERGTLVCTGHAAKPRPEEHTSETQSLMRLC